MIRSNRKTECAILDRLEKRYSAPHWVFLRELRNDTGFQSTRACDALAIGIYHSRGQEMIGFEKKISRADWLRELREPSKAEAIAQFCDRWYVVISDKNIVSLDELPSTWGLLLVVGSKISTLKEAPALTAKPLDRGFLAAVVERTIEQAIRPYQITKQEAKQEEIDAAFERGKHTAALELESYERIKDNVKAFEEASGIKINKYSDGRDLGERVKAVQRKESSIRDAERTVTYAISQLTERTLPALSEFLTSINQEQASQRVADPEAPDQQQCFVDPKVLKIGLGE